VLLSVSDINLFLRCEHEWWCKCVRKRVPRRGDAALYAGSLWHVLLAEYAKSQDKTKALETATGELARLRDELAVFGIEKTVEDFQKQADGLLAAFALYEDPTLGFETLAIETPIQARLPYRRLVQHELIGTPDRVVRAPDGRVWSVQYKTISDRTPPAVFVEMAQRTLHELVYAFLISEKYVLQEKDYGGTILNVTRKLSARGLRERPESAFIHEPIPIQWEQVSSALHDIATWGDRMERIALGLEPPTQNRTADCNRYGNVLSPYWEVRVGRARLEDDLWYMDASPRYGEVGALESAR